jgi:hypothetical protein
MDSWFNRLGRIGFQAVQRSDINECFPVNAKESKACGVNRSMSRSKFSTKPERAVGEEKTDRPASHLSQKLNMPQSSAE